MEIKLWPLGLGFDLDFEKKCDLYDLARDLCLWPVCRNDSLELELTSSTNNNYVLYYYSYQATYSYS